MPQIWTKEEDEQLQSDVQAKLNRRDIIAKWLDEKGFSKSRIVYRMQKLHLSKRHVWTEEEDKQLQSDVQAKLNQKGIFAKWKKEKDFSENHIAYRMQQLHLKIVRGEKNKNLIHVEVRVPKSLHFEIYKCANRARMNMGNWIKVALQKAVLEQVSESQELIKCDHDVGNHNMETE